MGNPETINIACATSREYLYPTGVMLSSLKGSLSGKSTISVYVFCTEDDVPVVSSHLRVLRDHQVSIDLVPIDSKLRKFDDWFKDIFKKNDRLSFNGLAGSKLLAYRLVPKNLAKIIWLDSDLVIRADISGLWNTLPAEFVAGVVQDENIPTAESRWGEQAKLLGIHASAKYFNSGVLLLDLVEFQKYINEDVIDALLSSYSQQRRSSLFKYYDQDFLNYLLQGKIFPVDPQWNQTKRESIGWKDILMPGNTISHGPYIQHYPHLDKPWLWKTSTVESIYFYEAAQKAPWPIKHSRLRWQLVVLYALARSPLRKLYRFIKKLI